MPGRKEVRGGAALNTLAGGITASSTSIQMNGVVGGWPTGIYPFVVAIDRGTAREERILCIALDGSNPATLTVGQRGFDGTTAQEHDPNATIAHVLDADTIDTLFDHVFNTARDDHGQYQRVDGTRPFTGTTQIAGAPFAVGTANGGGTANTLSRSDHIHRIGTGAINDPTQLADDVVPGRALQDDSIDGSKIEALSIGTSELVDGAVTPAKADGTLVNAYIATQALVNTATAVNVTTAGLVIDTGSITLPVGWNSMLCLIIGHYQFHMAPSDNANDVIARAIATLEAPTLTVLGQAYGISFVDTGASGINLEVDIPVNAILTVSANTTWAFRAQMDQGTSTAITVNQRHLNVVKIRLS